MSDYNGKYVKLLGNPMYWAVDDGERIQVRDMAHLYQIGLRPIVTISADELEAIPLRGKSGRGKKAVS